MDTEVGTLVARLRADTSQFSKGLKDAENDTQSFGQKMEDAGGKLMGFGAKMTLGVTLPLALLGKAGLDAASDLNESMSKTDAVFGSSAAAIHRWAEGSANDFGLSRQKAEDAAGSFGNMFTQLGMGVEPATRMSKKMTELAADFASFHNADITEVIQAQSAAFRGEYDALQRFVPTINAAAVETKALAMTGKENADSLTAQEKAAAVYALMMEGAGKAVGDFDRTADGAANKQRILTAKFEDAKATIGQALIPIFQQLATVVATLADKFSNLSPTAQKIVVVAGLALAAIGPLTTAIGGLVTVVGLLTGVAAPFIIIGAAIAALAAAAVLLYLKWDEVWSAVAKHPALLAILAPLGAILLPIIALVGAVKLVQDNWGTIWPILQGLVEAAGSVIGPVLSAIDAAARAIADAAQFLWGVWQAAWPTIQAILEVAWSVMQGILSAASSAVSAIGGAAQFLWDVWQAAWPVIQAVLETAWAGMQVQFGLLQGALDGVLGAIGWIKDQAGAAWDGFTSAVGAMWGAVQGPLNALKSVLDGVASAARAVKNAIDSIPDMPNVKLPGQGGGVPFIPGIATGGFVPPRPGGLLANIAEGGEGEWVVPQSKVGAFVAKHGGGGGGSVSNNYSINVTVEPGGSPAETGRAIVEAIKSYEDRSGATWRAA